MDDYSPPLDLTPGFYSLQVEWYDLQGGSMLQLWWETPSTGRTILPAGPLQPPLRARLPYPTNGDVNVPQEVTLSWSAGDSAAMHDVYFGEDAAAVRTASPQDAEVYKGSLPLDQTTWTTGPLQPNRTYYWRIDEVNADEPDSPWQGQVWSFTTAGSATDVLGQQP